MKSQKTKQLEALSNIQKDLKNHLKINDFSSLLTDFDNLTEEIVRSSNMIFEDKKDDILPHYILKNFMEIEDAINEITPE